MEEAEQSTISLIQLKKEKLAEHIPFIEEMMNKVAGSSLESQWVQMHQRVISDEITTMEDIVMLDDTLKMLKEESLKRKEKAKEVPLKSPVPSSPHVPKPTDLGKPLLSSEDLQSLIDDLSTAESDAPTQPPVKKVACEPLPVKVVKPPPKPEPKQVARMPSSWIPSKSTPPNRGKKESATFVSKFKAVPSSPSPAISPGESSSKLKSFDLFESKKEVSKKTDETSEEKKPTEAAKVLKSSAAEVKHRTLSVKRASTETLKETAKKKPMIRVNSPEELLEEMERSPVKKVKNSEEVPSKEKSKIEKKSMDEAKKYDLAVKKVEPEEGKSATKDTNLEEQPDTTLSPANTSIDKIEKRREKELRRLHENIVKTETPLPSRRSCTLKRTSFALLSSPNISDNEETPVVKRVKPENEEKSTKEVEENPAEPIKEELIKNIPESVKKELIRIKEDAAKYAVKKRRIRISLHPVEDLKVFKETAPKVYKRSGSLVSEKSVDSEDKESEKEVEQLKKKLEEYEKKFETLNSKPAKPEIAPAPGPAPKKQRSKRRAMKPHQKQQSKSGFAVKDEERLVREFHIYLKRNLQQLDWMKRRELPRKDPPQSKSIKKVVDKLRSKIREKFPNKANFDACAVNLPPIKATAVVPVNIKQTARKSTAALTPAIAAKVRKRPAPLGNIKNKSKKKFPMKTLTVKFEEEDDDEWEDVDDDEWEDVKEDEDDQWEDVKEEGSNDSSPGAFNSSFIYKHISNIGFAHCRNGAIFKCLLESCSFQTLEKHTFVSHLESSHPNERWNGYCNMCEAVVLKTKGGVGHSMINELFHMVDDHLKKEVESGLSEKELKKPAQAKPAERETGAKVVAKTDSVLPKIVPIVNLQNNQVIKEEAVEVKQEPVAQKVVISKNIVGRIIPLPASVLANSKTIKLPTGTTFKSITVPKLTPAPEQANNNSLLKPPVQKVTPTVASISPAAVVPKTVMKIPLTTMTIGSTKVVPAKTLEPPKKVDEKNVSPSAPKKNESTYLELLRPWLRSPTSKNPSVVKPMLTQNCLIARFKCMASCCQFFTSDEHLFLRHLRFHDRFTLEDHANYLSCCYCDYKNSQGSPQHIINHIKSSHGTDKYQCSYCFYRSNANFNVLIHLNNFHKMKPKKILVLPHAQSMKYQDSLEYAKKVRAQVVPAIVCVFCREHFYVFKSFMAHLNSHKVILNTKCVKCHEKTNNATLMKHLVRCHGFGLFQCVYCRFGCNTFSMICSHVANEHPSRAPLFCERSCSNHAMNPSSIESTTLKHISLTVRDDYLVTVNPDILHQRNYEALGSLGNNLNVKGFGKDPLLEELRASESFGEASKSDDVTESKPKPRIMTIRSGNQAQFDNQQPVKIQTKVVAAADTEATKQQILTNTMAYPKKKPVNHTELCLGKAADTLASSLYEKFKLLNEKTASLAELIKQPKKLQIEARMPHRRFTVDQRPNNVLMKKLPANKALNESKTVQSPIQAPEPKPLGLQIQSVFSLSDTRSGFSDGNYSD